MTTSPSSSSSNGLERGACSVAVQGLLDRLGISWTLIGAIAATKYRAEYRPTTDVDFLVEPNEGIVPGLVDAGFDVRVLEDEGEPHLIRARRSDGQADLIIAGTPYQTLAIERAVDHVLTVEDVLVHKLIAWRPRDQDDVRSILSTGLAFDDAYVEHWVGEWGVEGRWAEAQAWR
jgi:hypothetical protein